MQGNAGKNGAIAVVATAGLTQSGQFEQCREPGPIAGSRFTPEEMAKIKPPASAKNHL
jgi:hypothetical protein